MSGDKRPLILIADRQLGTFLSLESLLSLEGYRVTPCASSFAVQKSVARQRPDLVIAGRVGPESPPALVSHIKAQSPATSVLLLMESGDASLVAQAIAVGADALLSRPCTERQVIEQVNRLLKLIPA